MAPLLPFGVKVGENVGRLNWSWKKVHVANDHQRDGHVIEDMNMKALALPMKFKGYLRS